MENLGEGSGFWVQDFELKVFFAGLFGFFFVLLMMWLALIGDGMFASNSRGNGMSDKDEEGETEDGGLDSGLNWLDIGMG